MPRTNSIVPRASSRRAAARVASDRLDSKKSKVDNQTNGGGGGGGGSEPVAVSAADQAAIDAAILDLATAVPKGAKKKRAVKPKASTVATAAAMAAAAYPVPTPAPLSMDSKHTALPNSEAVAAAVAHAAATVAAAVSEDESSSVDDSFDQGVADAFAQPDETEHRSESLQEALAKARAVLREKTGKKSALEKRMAIDGRLQKKANFEEARLALDVKTRESDGKLVATVKGNVEHRLESHITTQVVERVFKDWCNTADGGIRSGYSMTGSAKEALRVALQAFATQMFQAANAAFQTSEGEEQVVKLRHAVAGMKAMAVGAPSNSVAHLFDNIPVIPTAPSELVDFLSDSKKNRETRLLELTRGAIKKEIDFGLGVFKSRANKRKADNALDVVTGDEEDDGGDSSSASSSSSAAAAAAASADVAVPKPVAQKASRKSATPKRMKPLVAAPAALDAFDL